MIRIAINAVIAKKKAKGGFQVAYNFLLASKKNLDAEWFYFVSEDMDDAIGSFFEQVRGSTYFVFPTQPDFRTIRSVQNQINELVIRLNIDIVYSILAPSYLKFRCLEVMRLANAWNYISNVNTYAWETLSIKERISMYLHAKFTCFLIKRTCFFVTQTEAAKKSIIKVTGTSDSNVKVVPNVLPAIYNDIEVVKFTNPKVINIVSISGISKHKNIDIIPKVAALLKSKYGIHNFKFHVTIPSSNTVYEDYFKSLSKQYGVEESVNIHDSMTQKQLGEFYLNCDICFFPSLLETFSATLLEAMYFQMPIVTSDLDFNKEVAQDAALYFQPQNAEDAARKLSSVINNHELYNSLIIKGQERLSLYKEYDLYFMNTFFFLKTVFEQNS